MVSTAIANAGSGIDARIYGSIGHPPIRERPRELRVLEVGCRITLFPLDFSLASRFSRWKCALALPKTSFIVEHGFLKSFGSRLLSIFNPFQKAMMELRQTLN